MAEKKSASRAERTKPRRKRTPKTPDRMILEYFQRSGSPEETLFKINEILYASKSRNTRRYVRAPMSVPVSYSSGGESRTSTSYTLSQRGIFIKSPDPLPEGSLLELVISLPDGGEDVKVRGTVVKSSPLEKALAENNLSGMSVVFKGIKPEDRRRIDKLVRAKARLLRKGRSAER